MLKLLDHSIYLVAHICAQACSIRILAELNPLWLLTAVTFAQVIATKTKICLVMEYVPGGQLSDKLVRWASSSSNSSWLLFRWFSLWFLNFLFKSYLKRLDETEAKKYFYQLIDAVDYCHRRGVFHRDLKVNIFPFSPS